MKSVGKEFLLNLVIDICTGGYLFSLFLMLIGYSKLHKSYISIIKFSLLFLFVLYLIRILYFIFEINRYAMKKYYKMSIFILLYLTIPGYLIYCIFFLLWFHMAFLWQTTYVKLHLKFIFKLGISIFTSISSTPSTWHNHRVFILNCWFLHRFWTRYNLSCLLNLPDKVK